MQTLPYLTEDIPPIAGRFRASPEDFRVDEIPAYPPSGEGDHLLLHIKKRDHTTKHAVGLISRALNADPSRSGWAGLKDRHAITTQWISVFGANADDAQAIEVPGVHILDAKAHARKLRTGHLKANKFCLVLRDVPEDRINDVGRVLKRLREHGMPNYYGEQRFGRDGNNADRARAWIVDGGKAPRGRFERKLLVSALQSELFNACVAERVAERGLGDVEQGEVMRKEDTGGVFFADDVALEQARSDRWETSPMGPMFGDDMRWPTDDALLREEVLLKRFGLERSHLHAMKKSGAGTRRVVRVRPLNATIEHLVQDTGTAVQLRFTLPKGTYATTIIREIFKQGAEGSN